MSRSRIFLASCLSFIVGVGFYEFLPDLDNIYWFAIVVSFFVFLALFWKNKKIKLICLVGLFLFLGIWRNGISIENNTIDKIWHYNDREVNFEGIVIDEPDLKDKIQKLKIKILDLSKYPDLKISGKVLVTTNIYPQYSYGDILRIKCSLKAPEPFSDFAYDKYLSRYDIYSVCYWPEIEFLQSKNSFFNPKKRIFEFKHRMKNAIDSGLKNKEASLANAMVLGYKKNISEDLRKIFSQAGLSHIMAISGMHIGVLIVIFQFFLLKIGICRKIIFWFILIFLIFYIILIGLPSSAVRASIMGLLALWAYNSGRLKNLINPLVFVASLMLFLNPKLLFYDIGFQLSFLAVLGIAIFYPLFKEKIVDRVENKFFNLVLNIFAVTISAQILTTPIVAINFNIISFIAPISNLLVLWTLPFLLITIILASFLSLLVPALSTFFFLPSFFILKFIILAAEILTNIPFAYLIIS